MMHTVTTEDAGLINTARTKTLKARPSIEELRKAIVDMKVLTKDQMRSLEVVPALINNDYILYLVHDTSTADPVCVLWAYAEKLNTDTGFLFSVGTGSDVASMRIEACALLNVPKQGSADEISYQYGGEILDKDDDIVLKTQLSDEQFASRITEVVRGDGGGRTRVMITATEEKLSAILDDDDASVNDQGETGDGSSDDDLFKD